MSRKKLGQLQQSADELAHFIFDNRKDGQIEDLLRVGGWEELAYFVDSIGKS